MEHLVRFRARPHRRQGREEVGPRRPSPSRLVAMGSAQGRVDALAERPERTRAAKVRPLVPRRPYRRARQLRGAVRQAPILQRAVGEEQEAEAPAVVPGEGHAAGDARRGLRDVRDRPGPAGARRRVRGEREGRRAPQDPGQATG